jgi:hypothetical protein
LSGVALTNPCGPPVQHPFVAHCRRGLWPPQWRELAMVTETGSSSGQDGFEPHPVNNALCSPTAFGMPRRTNMVRMAMSRQPRRVVSSHEAKRRRTWSCKRRPESAPWRSWATCSARCELRMLDAGSCGGFGLASPVGVAASTASASSRGARHFPAYQFPHPDRLVTLIAPGYACDRLSGRQVALHTSVQRRLLRNFSDQFDRGRVET